MAGILVVILIRFYIAEDIPLITEITESVVEQVKPIIIDNIPGICENKPSSEIGNVVIEQSEFNWGELSTTEKVAVICVGVVIMSVIAWNIYVKLSTGY